MTLELQGLVAVVTGASRGIGLAMAHELAAGGARVAMIARDAGRTEGAAAQIREERGRGYVCDVTDLQQIGDVVERIEGELGAIGILVNNAGMIRDKLLIRTRDEDWDEVLGTNLRGTFGMTRAVLRGMLRKRSGVIINISSVAGLVGSAGQTTYAAAKAGIIGFTKAVARELAPRGIRANVVAPGFIVTQMTSDLPQQARDNLIAKIPMGRLGEPEDVAPMVRFLAGPGGRYITGQVIVVDGGMVM